MKGSRFVVRRNSCRDFSVDRVCASVPDDFSAQPNTEQRRLESLIQIYDINQRLLALGFDRPELFEILQDSPDADPAWERHYLQLWFNQMAVIHFIKTRGLVSADFSKSLEADISDFLTMQNMQRHWRHHRQYYPSSFHAFIDAQIPTVKDRI